MTESFTHKSRRRCSLCFSVAILTDHVLRYYGDHPVVVENMVASSQQCAVILQ
ncbi:MAG: hypothetical protein ACRCWP_04175 [Shewanella sp.]